MSTTSVDIHTPVATEYLGTEQYNFSQEGKPSLKMKILTGNDAPWPGNSYIISYQNTSKVLTYADKGVTLTEFEGSSTQRWVCHTKNGWLGFANDPGETTRWLGFDKPDDADPKLSCLAANLDGWEMFCVRKRPDDGFVMFMSVKDRLRPIGPGKDGVLAVRTNWDHWWGFTKAT